MGFPFCCLQVEVLENVSIIPGLLDSSSFLLYSTLHNSKCHFGARPTRIQQQHLYIYGLLAIITSLSMVFC